MIGKFRETGQRTLNDLKRKKLIQSKGGTITIPDREALVGFGELIMAFHGM